MTFEEEINQKIFQLIVDKGVEKNKDKISCKIEGDKCIVIYLKTNQEHVWQRPDYCDCLDTIHDAEKFLFTEEFDWENYLDWFLPEICEIDDNPPECATALQRSKAILKTIEARKGHEKRK